MSAALAPAALPSAKRTDPSTTALTEVELPPDLARFREAVEDAPPPPSLPSRPKIRETVVRSILFRRRLAEALLTLELQVLDALRETGRQACRVGDYVLRDTPTGLSITEAPPSDARQLELPFREASSQKP
jgi:hypothetical protein